MNANDEIRIVVERRIQSFGTRITVEAKVSVGAFHSPWLLHAAVQECEQALDKHEQELRTKPMPEGGAK